ncbi:protein kinase [Aureococcus anophagefferens]|nr:protein kinase [Aureococcus anophagefferens]
MDSSGCGIAFFDSGHGFKTKEEDIADEEKFVEGCKVLRLVAQNKLDAVAAAVDAQPFLLNFRDYDRRTPLHIAASEGHVDIVEFLTSRGARVNRSDRWGSPLTTAAPRHHDVVAVLRKREARVGAVDYKTQLISAAAAGNVQEVAELLDDGAADVDSTDYDRRTALHVAASEGHVVVVRLLVHSGADPNARDRWGNGPLEGAEPGSKRGCAAGAEPLTTSADRALALKDFTIEASILRRLRHPNIVMLLAFSTIRGREIILSELMRCSVLDELQALAPGKTLPRPRALRWATEIARGMAYLHSCKPPVLHRDLKPGNLLLDGSGSCRISDFGLATFRADNRASSPDGGPGESFSDLTGATGSYRFMAPEVALSKPYGRPVDVYSFAMILYNVYDRRALVRRDGQGGEARDRRRPPIPATGTRRSAARRLCWAHEPFERPPSPPCSTSSTPRDAVDVEAPPARQPAGGGRWPSGPDATPATKPCCVVM